MTYKVHSCCFFDFWRYMRITVIVNTLFWAILHEETAFSPLATRVLFLFSRNISGSQFSLFSQIKQGEACYTLCYNICHNALQAQSLCTSFQDFVVIHYNCHILVQWFSQLCVEQIPMYQHFVVPRLLKKNRGDWIRGCVHPSIRPAKTFVCPSIHASENLTKNMEVGHNLATTGGGGHVDPCGLYLSMCGNHTGHCIH